MLEDVEQLSDSTTAQQAKALKSALGDRLYGLLDSALDSESEEEAVERVGKFVGEAKKKSNIMKMIKARKLLTPEQKQIVMKFLGD